MLIKKWAPAVLLGAVIMTGCGQEESVKLETAADQASYGVGLNIGRQLAREPFDMNGDAVIAGIRDAIAEADPQITEEVIQAAFQTITEEQQRKQQALGDEVAKASEAFLAENATRDGVKVTESGLQYEVLTSVENGDSPAATDTVKVHYHGTLTDGTVFDSSVDRGEPAQFPVNRVISGWIEALQMMKVGEKWKLFIPADLAYGATSPSPTIPANSALIFEVEMLEIVAAN